MKSLSRENHGPEFSVRLWFDGEGLNGEFDANSPSDMPLLRLEISTDEESVALCTCIAADEPDDVYPAILDKMVAKIAANIEHEELLEICESLSWWSVTDQVGVIPLPR
jgi:hypothetical protein